MSANGKRAWMLIPSSRERFDGIRDFARNLASALAPAQRVECLTSSGDAGGRAGLRVLGDWKALRVPPDPPDVVYVNYLPTAWLRRDTPHLLATLSRARRAGARVVVIIHEYQVDRDGSLRRAGVRALFRTLARAFARRADVLVVTHTLIARRLERDGIDRIARIALVPIGSNVPLSAGSVAPSGGVVMFGQPSSMDAAMVAALARMLAESGHPPLRWMCRDASELQRWLDASAVPSGHVEILAGLGEAEASAELRGASLAFAPFSDGVSTRRSTVSAFLEHALPVAGVTGPATDTVFAESGAFLLAPRAEAASMAVAVAALLGDPARRHAMSAAAARMFDSRLSWPRIGRDYLELTK